MGVFSDLYESLFGDLEGQAREQDTQGQAYLDRLGQQAGEVFLQDGTALDRLDPTTRAAQMRALQQMQEIADAKGITAQDRNQLDIINRQVGQQEKSARDAIMQAQAQRGTLGGGAGLAAQMMAQQAGADRRASGGLQTAADAQQRALQAIQSGATMAGNIGQQDMQQAQARDAIQQFNARQRESGLNRRMGVGQMQFGQYGRRADQLRERQKRGEETLGGIIDTASRFIPVPKAG